MLRNEVVEAPVVVATEMGVEPGTSLLHLERFRMAGDNPLAILRHWLPESLLSPSDAELEAHGVYELIRGGGTHLRIARQRIGARGASAWEADHLGEPEGAPLLTMRRTSYDDRGRVVESGDHVYSAETCSFQVTLVER